MSRYWRLGLRATIHASESAKVVAALLPPGSVVGNSALTESTPSDLGWGERLLILGLLTHVQPIGTRQNTWRQT